MLALLPASALANTAPQIIVKRAPGLTAAERRDIRADADVRFVESLSLPRTEVVAAEPGDLRDAVRDLNADPDVLYAEPNRLRVAAQPDDTHFGELWAFPQIGVEPAWQLQEASPAANFVTGLGQMVAVVDSGIDETHPDLHNQIHSVRNFVEEEDPLDAVDGDGHGTHVSGTIVAERNNGQGVAGIAPDAQVMALRALDDTGGGWDSDIAEAFEYAGDAGAKIVNASLAGEGGSKTLRAAISSAEDTLFVVAAGNGGEDLEADDNDATPNYPCNTPEPNVLCVGATDDDDVATAFSNYGRRAVDLFAPGVWIASTIPVALAGPEFDLDDEDFGQEPYEYMHGTSMATPHVAAVAALVLQADPDLTPQQLKLILLGSATPVPGLQGVSVSGARLQADAAVQLALNGTWSSLPDGDGDGWPDVADSCPTAGVEDSPDGCPLDDDWDGELNADDNCVEDLNPGQEDTDGDHSGDACDLDVDNDGVPNSGDLCDFKVGPSSNRGCPLPPSGPPPGGGGGGGGGGTGPTPPADSDHDGVINGVDTCPFVPAATPNGCPLAQVSGVSTKVRKRGQRRSATIRVATNDVATLRVTVERKKGRRWVRVKRRTIMTSGNLASLRVSRLKRGRHRVRISISNSAGSGTSVSKTFRVR
jgi:subtilisin family serine protease